MEFAKRLKELRESKDLTQGSLANLLGLQRSTIAGYETGRKEPGFAELIKIAGLFRVSTDYLLGITDVMPTINEILQPFEGIDGLQEFVTKCTQGVSLYNLIASVENLTDEQIDICINVIKAFANKLRDDV